MADLVLPTLHQAQRQIYWNRTRRNALRCGRRFGKDIYMITRSADAAAKGLQVGIFAPEFKQLSEPFSTLREILWPIRRTASRNDGEIKTTTRGKIDFWTLNDNELAGRGREYDLIFINEAGFTKSPQMWKETWDKAIEPTLLIRAGEVNVMSTPAGTDPENFFYACCKDPHLEFKEFYAPSSLNPLVSPEELERHRRNKPPLVFAQEYLAKFVDWSGEAFFGEDKMLVDGEPVPYPVRCDAIYAVLDTAVKDGRQHDGTAVVYFGITMLPTPQLWILDYDIVQIEGSLLESWLPTIYQRLEELVPLAGARRGHLGTFIEDKASGTILLQQAARRGWRATAIDSKLTAEGKDSRAISVSGYHHQGRIKITRHAYDKLVTFKGSMRNHLVSQVLGYRVGDKDAHNRADDLLDCYCYGISIGLGNPDGY